MSSMKNFYSSFLAQNAYKSGLKGCNKNLIQ